jgi:hypothetical protein
LNKALEIKSLRVTTPEILAMNDAGAQDRGNTPRVAGKQRKPGECVHKRIDM